MFSLCNFVFQISKYLKEKEVHKLVVINKATHGTIDKLIEQILLAIKERTLDMLLDHGVM